MNVPISTIKQTVHVKMMHGVGAIKAKVLHSQFYKQSNMSINLRALYVLFNPRESSNDVVFNARSYSFHLSMPVFIYWLLALFMTTRFMCILHGWGE